MAQCAATATTTGRRCRLHAEEDSGLCNVHRDLEELGIPTRALEPEPGPDPDPDPGEPGDSKAGIFAVLALAAAVVVKLVRG